MLYTAVSQVLIEFLKKIIAKLFFSKKNTCASLLITVKVWEKYMRSGWPQGKVAKSLSNRDSAGRDISWGKIPPRVLPLHTGWSRNTEVWKSLLSIRVVNDSEFTLRRLIAENYNNEQPWIQFPKNTLFSCIDLKLMYDPNHQNKHYLMTLEVQHTSVVWLSSFNRDDVPRI